MPDVYFQTSTTNYDQTVQAYINRRIEENLRSKAGLHLVDAQRAMYVPGTNGTMRFITYTDPSVTTNNGTVSAGTQPWLTEGTPPSIESLAIAYEEMTAYQMGRAWGLYDVAADESAHDLIAIHGDRVSFNGVRTVDDYVKEIIAAATAVTNGEIYSGASSSSTATVGTGDLLTGIDIKKAVKALAAANVPTFPDGYYHAIIHPNCVYGLMVDDDAGGWIDANKYTDAAPLLAGELGRYAGVRFMETSYTNIRTSEGESSIDVYDTLVYGPDAWVVGDLQLLRSYIQRGGGVTDPLEQIRATIGWKAMIGAKARSSSGSGARFARVQSSGS